MKRIEITLPDDGASAADESIFRTALTGRIGDGRLFIAPAEEVFRICAPARRLVAAPL